MQQKAFTLLNKGMNRDLSISKVGESSAYENHNIRILARENDTTLSVTNEKGNRQIHLGNINGIQGDLIGWNVLNNHIILFTHWENSFEGKDYIYRIDYTEDKETKQNKFEMYGDNYLYNGNLGFDTEHPIESVVYYETEDIQKIYWVDGINVLRFMNFAADEDERRNWDDTYFDSNRKADFGVKASITKDNSGNTRANGVVQYLLTYYNKHGQETGIVWVSDLVYLSPTTRGGAADETNNNKVSITLSNLDTSFTNFRVYSIFRSSYNGQAVAYIVQDGETSEDNVIVVDDASHLVTEDVQRLLYLGSQDVRAGTLTHKDQTLFIGDFQSIGKSSYDYLENAIKKMYDAETGMSNCITFRYSDSSIADIQDIPYVADTGTYDYKNQLNLTSSQILSFKGGEKYRFALTFRRQDGSMTEAFWIGDAENELYPVVDVPNQCLKRIVAECTIPDGVVRGMELAKFETAQLMIAEATYADRSVKAQGIINPTVFNVWDRYNKRIYGESSWISRPRNSGFAYKHFEPIHNSTSSTGEIDCNYWETDSAPTPYYQLNGNAYTDEFDGLPTGDYRMVVYAIKNKGKTDYEAQVYLITAEVPSTGSSLFTHEFSFDEFNLLFTNGEFTADDGTFTLSLVKTEKYSSPTKKNSAANLYPIVKAACIDILGLSQDDIISQSRFVDTWCASVGKNVIKCFNPLGSSAGYDTVREAMNNGGTPSSSVWEDLSAPAGRSDYDYIPAYYRKHLMFVDENLVTLNSPEIAYETVSFDNAENYKLRIVGLARITSTSGDYTVDATPGKLPGENLIQEKFVGDTDGLISWPLWKEYALKEKTGEDVNVPTNIKKRSSEHYDWLEDAVTYWLHMWNHSGKINGYTDSENSDYSRLNTKVFANLRYSYDTIYNMDRDNDWKVDIPSGALRLFNYTHSQYLNVKIGAESKMYDANIKQSLLPPGTHKYKVLYSENNPETTSELIGNAAFLYLNSPVQIDYLSSPHAVIALPTKESTTYEQTILPYVGPASGKTYVPRSIRLPWKDGVTAYEIKQEQFDFTTHQNAGSWSYNERYLFIGEIYYDYNAPGVVDTRYGDVKNNRFVTAGPQYTLSRLGQNKKMYANQGDTYFQRWDCLKTQPAAVNDVTNNVIDITSVMLETHINIDGRTDNQRGTEYVASINTEQFGQTNQVYSQQNNYFTQRDLDEDFNLDSYRSSISWTLEKTDSAEIDEWSHITLASSLKLDGDKGSCNALRRFQNSIIAFQDKGIAEILFNSRTQLTTTDGVPIEVANSGKVDGKAYVSNKFGCTNKWSIVEGKNALYFVDNINKAFCGFNGGVTPISSQKGFDVWFRRNNKLNPWNPKDWNNIVAYYDRIHSDVYLVRGDNNDDEQCLVYNEALGEFTSFFDYGKVPMMTNVIDKYVSFKKGVLWAQNEGPYCNFFGDQYDYWVRYRVTPDPYGDKIWTNIDYRADFYQTVDSEGFLIPGEDELINADDVGYLHDTYKENETFTSYKIWNEYQTTGDVSLATDTTRIDPVRKKFRIWRLAIPRALKHDTNRYGLDRIRNPWINIEFRKTMSDNKLLMQLHDIIVKYYE